MTYERWITLATLIFCLAYGYSSFFIMDGMLQPFAKLSPVWPSSFPKILSILGIGLSLGLLTIWHKPGGQAEIDMKNLARYQWKQVASILAMMIMYALFLRGAGFVLSTILFLILSSRILGDRKWIVMGLISSVSTVGIWYLVDQVLGIFLRPWPFVFYGGM